MSVPREKTALTLDQQQWIEKGKKSLATYHVAKESGLDLLVEVPHWRDDIYASRGSALLGYSAIMIAAALVFLTAEPNSFLAPKGQAARCAHISFASLTMFFFAAFLSLYSVVMRFNSRGSADGIVQDVDQLWMRLGKIAASHERRRRWQSLASIVAAIGTLLFLFALISSTYVGTCFI